ncbi:hypothetical protein, partial [Arcticibacter tournemirensis]
MQSQNGRYGARLLRQKGGREGTGRPEKGGTEAEKGARKKVKKVLAEKKKDSHLCSPKTGQPK